MRTLIAAVGLLTRIPVPAVADAETAGKATRWFPLVGALIGAIYAAVAWAGMLRLPAAVAAVFVLVTEALLTGAIHMDGVADMADGFGGGKTREEILRIMRDPSIGSYGAVALALLVAFKITVLAQLLGRHRAFPYLIVAAVLGRWTPAPLARFLPYARPTKGPPAFVGTNEFLWSTALTAAIIATLGVPWMFLCWAVVAVATAAFGGFCYRKIGGITGDTLGAAIETAECLILLCGVVR
jgi:adenosylcobinamide-GDP ribazoletransferase